MPRAPIPVPRSNDTPSAHPVVDQHVDLPCFREVSCHEARNDVRAAARREGDDDADLLRRKFRGSIGRLRPRQSRRQKHGDDHGAQDR